MRILLTADPMIPVPPVGYGGIERIVDALVRQYRRAGHTVGLLAHAASTCPADPRVGWPSDRVRGAMATFRNAITLRRMTAQFRPEIVHSFSRLAYLLPLMRSKMPIIMSYQRHTGGRQITWAARVGGRSLEFTGCSDYIARMGRRSGGAWTAIPNFVELDRFTFRASVSADAPLVFLSRLDDIKGPEVAIAVARAAGRRLILAGNRADAGPQRDFFEREVSPQLDGDRIRWIGEVNDRQKNELLGKAAALLVPIQWDEPFGIVFAESLACGTPVITTRRGATPEIVESGATGFLIDSVQDGIDAVHRIGSIVRANCRRAAETKFSSEVVANRYLELYTRMNHFAVRSS